MIIYILLKLVCSVASTIIPKCIGTVPLLGNTIPLNMFKITFTFTLVILHFFQQFAKPEAIPSTSTVTPELHHIDIICKKATAAKQFLEEEINKSIFPLIEEHESRPLKAH